MNPSIANGGGAVLPSLRRGCIDFFFYNLSYIRYPLEKCQLPGEK